MGGGKTSRGGATYAGGTAHGTQVRTLDGALSGDTASRSGRAAGGIGRRGVAVLLLRELHIILDVLEAVIKLLRLGEAVRGVGGLLGNGVAACGLLGLRAGEGHAGE